MTQLHCPHALPTCAVAEDDGVVTVPAWWCVTCGRGEADEEIHACRDCLFMQTGAHVRVATAAGRPIAVGLDRGLAELERAQQLIGDAEVRMEHLLEGLDGRVRAVLDGTADVLHEAGAVLLGMHSALTVARLAVEGGR